MTFWLADVLVLSIKGLGYSLCPLIYYIHRSAFVICKGYGECTKLRLADVGYMQVLMGQHQ